jgi:hypothetical protein
VERLELEGQQAVGVGIEFEVHFFSPSTHWEFSAACKPATTAKRQLQMSAAHCGSSLAGPRSCFLSQTRRSCFSLSVQTSASTRAESWWL